MPTNLECNFDYYIKYLLFSQKDTLPVNKQGDESKGNSQLHHKNSINLSYKCWKRNWINFNTGKIVKYRINHAGWSNESIPI